VSLVQQDYSVLVGYSELYKLPQGPYVLYTPVTSGIDFNGGRRTTGLYR
jgi:hypothetical protein